MKDNVRNEFLVAYIHLRNNQNIAAYNEFIRLAETVQKTNNYYSALFYILAAECKKKQGKDMHYELLEAGKQYLNIASKDIGYNSKYAYVAASKCFMRSGEYDLSQKAFNNSQKISITLTEQQRAIVIVEDSKAMIMKISSYLETLGYKKIHTFSLGHDVLDSFETLLKKEKNPIVLLDMGLPDISGDKIAEKLLEIKLDTIIILITADEKTSERVHNTISQGVSAFIQKPFSIDDLKKALDKVETEETILKKK